MKDKILTVERLFNATKHDVWRAITEKNLMKKWYFDLPEFKAEVGFRFAFLGGPQDGVQYNHLCEIIEVVANQKLCYTWRYEGYAGVSYLTFELFEVEKNTTKLILTHAGLETFPSDIADFAVHNFEAGWDFIINTSLKDFLENKALNNLDELLATRD